MWERNVSDPKIEWIIFIAREVNTMQFPSKIKKLAVAVALATGGTALVACTLSPALALDVTPPARVEMTVPDFSALVEQNAAAVVNVSVTGKTQPTAVWRGRGAPDQDDDDNPLAPFFKHFPTPPIPPGSKGMPTQGMGSGFIISTDGYIVTNHHVVDGADKIMVKLNDKREFPAKVIGSDPRSDIALLKIDAKDLPVVSFGNADELKVGEWVVAIGNITVGGTA